MANSMGPDQPAQMHRLIWTNAGHSAPNFAKAPLSPDVTHINVCLGVLQAQGAGTLDAADKGIFDLYLAKYWGLKFATAAACTVLKVDQVTSHCCSLQ